MIKLFLLIIFIIINNFCEKTIIIFVHPSTICNISGESFFPAIQNIKLPGLHKITRESLLNNCYCEVFLPFVNQYNIYFKEPTSFYMFNWTGNIYPLYYKKIASQELFDSLIKYKNKNPNDKIILIGCSHGGNVILGMAPLLKKFNINIDLIILLGTPISKDSNKYTLEKLSNQSYIFTKIINIYSLSDYIQKIDIIFNDFKLCERILNQRKGIINYRINNTFGHINLWHKLIWKEPFVIQIPKILSLLSF